MKIGLHKKSLITLRGEEKRRQEEIEETIKKDKEIRIDQAKKAWDRAQTLPQSKNHSAYLELKKIKNHGGRYSFDSFDMAFQELQDLKESVYVCVR